MNKRIEEILNQQIEKEAYSSNLYLSMASWAETQGYAGIAKWLYAQADEEHQHMLMFMKHLNERGGHAIVPELKMPPMDFVNIKDMFNDVLKHEVYITDCIHAIVALCVEEKDYSTHNWIQWFVTEQIEEVSSVQTIIDKLNMLGDHNMYIFDRDILSLRGESK